MRNTKVVFLALLVAALWGCDSRGALEEPAPETPQAFRFFPLAVGHVWEYERFAQTGDDFCPNEWTLSGYLRYEVRDPVIVQGRSYFQMAGIEYDLNGVPFNTYELTVGYDTSAVRVITLRPDGTEQTWFANPRELATPVGEVAACGGPDPYITLGSEDWVGAISGDSLTGSFKRFETNFFSAWFSYVQDVGLISSGQFDCGGSRNDLIFARIDGRGVGKRKIPIAGVN